MSINSSFNFKVPTCSEVFSEVRTFSENFYRGAKEGLFSFVPLSIGLSLIVNPLLGSDRSCSFKNYLEENSEYPFFETVVNAPIWEETLFRRLIQGILIPLSWYIIVKNVEPNNPILLRKKVQRAVRYFFSALMFGTAHLLGGNESISTYQKCQSVGAFFIGLKLSQICESPLSYPGAVGAHSVNNLIAYSGMKYLCQ